MFFRQPDPTLELEAAIVVNELNYMEVANGTVQYPAACVEGVWTAGSVPLLTIMNLQCQLASSFGRRK